MNSLLKIVEQTAIDILLNQKQSMGSLVRKSKVMTPFIALSTCVAIIGLAFAQYAAFLWFKSLYSSEIAALATAGLAFAIAIFSIIIGYLTLSVRRKKIEHKKKEMSDVIQSTLEILQKEVNDNVQSNPKMSVLSAVIAGYVAGNY